MARSKTESVQFRLRAIREARGYSQTQLAELLDMDQVRYCNIENGHTTLKAYTLHRLAKVMQVGMCCFFDGELTVEQWESERDERSMLLARLEASNDMVGRMETRIQALTDRIIDLERLVANKEELLAVERYRMKRKDNTILIILGSCAFYIYLRLLTLLLTGSATF